MFVLCRPASPSRSQPLLNTGGDFVNPHPNTVKNDSVYCLQMTPDLSGGDGQILHYYHARQLPGTTLLTMIFKIDQKCACSWISISTFPLALIREIRNVEIPTVSERGSIRIYIYFIPFCITILTLGLGYQSMWCL